MDPLSDAALDGAVEKLLAWLAAVPQGPPIRAAWFPLTLEPASLPIVTGPECECGRFKEKCSRLIWRQTTGWALWLSDALAITTATITVQAKVLHSVSMVTTGVAIVTRFSAMVPGPQCQHVSCPLGRRPRPTPHPTPTPSPPYPTPPPPPTHTHYTEQRTGMARSGVMGYRGEVQTNPTFEQQHFPGTHHLRHYHLPFFNIIITITFIIINITVIIIPSEYSPLRKTVYGLSPTAAAMTPERAMPVLCSV
ncbi:hypothetical protein CRUP_024230 [Coryphaenoides rupestris]|nr:hypothetical protein CRUP_024230 [Coryphaenoides rupestris]